MHDAEEEEASPVTTVGTEPGKRVSLTNTNTWNCAGLIFQVLAMKTKILIK